MRRERGTSRQDVRGLNAGLVGLVLAVLLSGCFSSGCTCTRPPEAHFTIDGYDVAVELSIFPPGSYAAAQTVYSSSATIWTAPPNADMASALWKAVEIVANEKCPNGYFWYDRDQSPYHPTQIFAKWACGG
jgi:hypothetical protein